MVISSHLLKLPMTILVTIFYRTKIQLGTNPDIRLFKLFFEKFTLVFFHFLHVHLHHLHHFFH